MIPHYIEVVGHLGYTGPMYAAEHPAPKGNVALFYHPAYLEHVMGDHPEAAGRLLGILAALDARGITENDLRKPCAADPDLLAAVHDPRYIAALEKGAESGGGYWDADTYISPGSYKAAVMAAGGAVAAVDAVMTGEQRAAFALVRPPGHHALYNSAMGFCLLNNVAIAAHHTARKYGVERVMIVDWDVHHGNGTQDLFYNSRNILFFTTHQYPFYPGTGAITETGEGSGEGYTVNVPLPAGVGDEGYIQVFDRVLVPLARRYKPQLVLISAGYDAHIADPLGEMAVSVAGFAEMALKVRRLADELCEGRVAAILEGGYNIEALAQSVVATIGMLGTASDAPQTKEEPEKRETMHADHTSRRAPDISNIIRQVQQLHHLS